MDNDQDRYEYEVMRQQYEEGLEAQRTFNGDVADAIIGLMEALTDAPEIN